MARVLLRTLLLSLSVNGCVPGGEVVDFGAPWASYRYVIVASMPNDDASEAPIAALFDLEAGPPAPLVTASAERAVHVFPIGADQLVDPEGAPIDPARLRISAAAESADARHGACGRCLAPSDRAPAVLFPGDRCPIPSSIPVLSRGGDPSIAAGQVQRLRRELRIEVAGVCPCGATKMVPETGPALDFDFVHGDDPWPFYISATLPSGARGGFNERRFKLERAGEPDRVREGDLPLSPRARPIAAFGLREELFLVEERDDRTLRERFFLIDETLNSIGDFELSIAPFAAERIFALESGRRVLAGTAGSPADPRSELVSCRIERTPAAFACESITTPALRDQLGTLRNVWEFEPGKMVWWSRVGFAYGSEAPNGVVTWRMPDPRPRRFPSRDGSYEVTSFTLSDVWARIDDRLFVCGTGQVASSTISGAFVLSATVSAEAAGLTGTAIPKVDYTVSFFERGGSCSRFTPVDGDRLDAQLGALRRVRVDADGAVVESEGRAAAPRLHPLDTAFTALAKSDRAFYAFGTKDRVSRVDFQTDRVTSHALPGFSVCDTVSALAPDPETNELVVLGFVTPGCDVLRSPNDPAPEVESWIRRVTIEESAEPRFTVRDVTIAAALRLAPGLRYLGLAPLGPGRFVLIAQSADPSRRSGLYRLFEDTLSSVDVSFGDLGAGVSAPPDSGCSARRSMDGAKSEPWRGIAAGFGVVWVVGCDGALLRVTPAGTQRIAPARAAWRAGASALEVQEITEGPHFYAAQVRCPDHVLVGGERGRLYEVRPAAGAERAGLPENAAGPLLARGPSAALLDQNRLGAGVLALFAAGSRIDVIHQRFQSDISYAFRYGADRDVVFPARANAALDGPDGRILLAFARGYLALSRR